MQYICCSGFSLWWKVVEKNRKEVHKKEQKKFHEKVIKTSALIGTKYKNNNEILNQLNKNDETTYVVIHL